MAAVTEVLSTGGNTLQSCLCASAALTRGKCSVQKYGTHNYAKQLPVRKMISSIPKGMELRVPQ